MGGQIEILGKELYKLSLQLNLVSSGLVGENSVPNPHSIKKSVFYWSTDRPLAQLTQISCEGSTRIKNITYVVTAL